MVTRCLIRLGLVLCLLAQSAPELGAQSQPTRVSVVYTARSLGAMGAQRAQDEHELLAEVAVAESVPFKLVSHLAWRAPGIVIFLPSEEPLGDELAEILEGREQAEALEELPAMISANVLLIQDPWRPQPDLLAMIDRNPRRQRDFGDLVRTTVRASRLRTARGDRAIIIERPGAVWPRDTAGFTTGEMNRLDLLDSRLFELPLNLGELGPRATLLARLRSNGSAQSVAVITVDLGHQNADVGLERPSRARLDFTALRELGYSLLVPYEFELGLGADGLAALAREFPEVGLLAANVATADSSLFKARVIVEQAGVRLGFLGLVSGELRDRLPRSALAGFRFESPVSAARREVAALQAAGATAIVVLSNMSAPENALVAEEVRGIDAIVADLPAASAPEDRRVRVELPARPFVRPSSPAIVARSAANGIGVGRLDLEFQSSAGGGQPYLKAVEHRLSMVTDDTPSDTGFVRRLRGLVSLDPQPRGELMLPAFVDLVERRPALRDFDAVTAQGRVSKPMWEAFLARLLRQRGNAEASVIRRLDQFPPLIGKLHENEIGQWLWTEDEIVILDLPGSDLLALLRDDRRGELATSGIDFAAGSINGRPIDGATFYRVATSDVLYEGARSRFFTRARRVRRRFEIGAGGVLEATVRGGEPLAIKPWALAELRRVRGVARGTAQVDSIAAMLAPDSRYEPLFSFMFQRPTLWVSTNSVSTRTGYENVPESRIVGANAWVAGASGRFVVSQDRMRVATDLGIGLAFAEQHLTAGGNARVVETTDDIRIDLTLRPSSANRGRRLQPFVRALFDSEFSPTRNTASGLRNARQLSLRGMSGLLLTPTERWPRTELAAVVENDYGRPNPQVGVQARGDYERQIGGGAGRREFGRVRYRMVNDLTYFFPAPLDTDANLALRYNQIHEIVVPLVDELSLAVSADLMFFKGKVPGSLMPGMASQLRVGITYDRLWKPRYQPLL